MNIDFIGQRKPLASRAVVPAIDLDMDVWSCCTKLLQVDFYDAFVGTKVTNFLIEKDCSVKPGARGRQDVRDSFCLLLGHMYCLHDGARRDFKQWKIAKSVYIVFESVERFVDAPVPLRCLLDFTELRPRVEKHEVHSPQTLNFKSGCVLPSLLRLLFDLPIDDTDTTKDCPYGANCLNPGSGAAREESREPVPATSCDECDDSEYCQENQCSDYLGPPMNFCRFIGHFNVVPGSCEVNTGAKS